MSEQRIISAADLVCMDELQSAHRFRVELAYAHPENLLFGEQIYRSSAKLWLHRDLAEIVLKAAAIAHDRYSYQLILYDGLRTIEAQERMLRTKAVKDNPHWLIEPRLLSTPGAGGHPRAMAIDLALEDTSGRLLDMGTPFDFLSASQHPEHNPAHRDFAKLSQSVRTNRTMLDSCMQEGAAICGREIYPLPRGWWDYRFPAAGYERYAPLSERDLPPEMQMMPV